MTTEILVQPLANANRNPQKGRYRTKAFNAFTATPNTFVLLVPAGVYAVAIRFVKTTTGQEAGIVPLGVFAVS